MPPFIDRLVPHDAEDRPALLCGTSLSVNGGTVPDSVYHDGECGAATSMAAYNLGAPSCDYAGLFHAGTLISPPFTLTGHPPYFVGFDSMRALDATGSDTTTVSIAVVGGGRTQVLAASTDLDDSGVLESLLIELDDPASWAGKTVELRFHFAASFGGNDTLGWLVDAVQVTNQGPWRLAALSEAGTTTGGGPRS